MYVIIRRGGAPERTDAMAEEEWFDVVNEADEVIGRAPRRRCHGDPSLIHRTAHVAVTPPGGGALLLQLRARTKDIQPGKWDTAVGGHLRPGEDYEAAARREMNEVFIFKNVLFVILPSIRTSFIKSIYSTANVSNRA